MKLPRRRTTRVLAMTTAAVVIAGAAAVADTSQIGVGVGVVNGMRSLQVTGTDFAGATNLAFRNQVFEAPLGVMVNDIAYSRTGYDVSATLSNLYRLDDSDDGYDCASVVESKDLSLTFTGTGSVSGATHAFVEPVMDFTGSFAVQDLLDLGLLSLLDLTTLDLLAADQLAVSVSDIQGLLDDALYGAALMDVANGANTLATFDAPASHPCLAGTGTSRFLQGGAPIDPSATQLAELTDEVFAGAATDTTLTAAEAIAGGLLGDQADDDGGILWEATYTAVLNTLAAEGISLDLTDPAVLADLDALVADVITGLTSTIAGFVLDVVGQTGSYRNLPVLQLSETAVTDVPTGLYHGVMTVTLTDR